MAANWTPPAEGAPCWTNILASDVPRAKKFYESVFKWTFPPKTNQHGKPYDEKMIAMFETPGQPSTEGGITQTETGDFVPPKGKGGVVLYLYVTDLGGWEEKVINAGGKKATEIQPEGDTGLMQNFEDTEGNWVGLWTMKK